MLVEAPSAFERLGAIGSSEVLFVNDILMPGANLLVAEEPRTFTQPAMEMLAREVPAPASTLAAKPVDARARPESPKPEHDIRPFVLAVRTLIENERLTAARQMIDAAPAYILSDLLVARLRSVLAPPVVKRVQKRDVDRSREYEWLRTHGNEHRGRWVALVGPNLLASAPTLGQLRQQLQDMALPNAPLLHRVD